MGDRLAEISAKWTQHPYNGLPEPNADVGWLLERIVELQEQAEGNGAGLRYWNRRYVETTQQHAVDIAARDAARAELAVLRAQRDAALQLCKTEWRRPGHELARRVRAALGVQPEPADE